MKKTSKYKAKKCIIDGIKFDSIAEGDYYCKLKNEVLVGVIKKFSLQPKFTIQRKFKHPTEGNIRAIVYKADFMVECNNGSIYIVDVKGKATPGALLKYKMFLNIYPWYDLRWLVKNKKHSVNGWIDYFELEKIRRVNRKLKKGKK